MDDVVIPSREIPLPRRLAVHVLRHTPQILWRGYNWAWRRTGRHRLARTYFGAVMECDIGDFIDMFIFHFGVWEPHISALLQQRLRPGDVFCDVGANTGYHSLLAAKMVGPSGGVVAVEASPSIFATLRSNITRNGTTNVRAVQAAVTSAPGPVALYRGVDGNSGTASVLPSHGMVREAEVEGRPLVDLLTHDERSRLRLVKIDVEGAEAPIVDQILETLHLFRPDLEVLVEFSRDWAKVDDVLRRFAASGYRAYAIDNPYDVESYLHFKAPAAPVLLSSPVRRQQDILLTPRDLGT